jgi:hypothetical protein
VVTDDFFWGPTGIMWEEPELPDIKPTFSLYRTFGTSAWFRPDGSPASPSEHIEIDRHMNALLRKQMEPT